MTENSIKTDSKPLSSTPKKGKGQLLLIIVLFLICGILGWEVFSLRNQMKDLMGDNDELVVEKDQLQLEFDVMLLEYDSVKTQYGELTENLSEKDSIIQANMKEIQKLLATQGDYRRVKKKLAYLRGITQTYVSQLDSLFTVSKELKEENIHLTANLDTFKKKTTVLSNQKDSLSKQVEKGSVLYVFNINPSSIRMKGGDREIETDKAKKVEKIRVCFTIGKNMVVDAGKQFVYLRIADPNGEIMNLGRGDEYSFVDASGAQLQYSIKQEVDYKNRNLDVCCYWDRTEEFVEGMYVASIFIGGELVGEANFSLR